MHINLGLGVIVQVVKNLWNSIPKAIEDYKFKRFFGKEACENGNFYLVLDPHEHIMPLTPVTQERFRKRFHGRRADVILRGADPIVGTGAIRVTTYASTESARHLPIERALKAKLDSDVMNSWDGTFICYGSSSSNIKTFDIERLPENNLYRLGTTQRHGMPFPCWVVNGHEYTVTQNDTAVLMLEKQSQ
jgi:hypothetical protein